MGELAVCKSQYETINAISKVSSAKCMIVQVWRVQVSDFRRARISQDGECMRKQQDGDQGVDVPLRPWLRVRLLYRWCRVMRDEFVLNRAGRRAGGWRNVSGRAGVAEAAGVAGLSTAFEVEEGGML